MIASGHSEAAPVITSVQLAGRAFFMPSFIFSAAASRLCAKAGDRYVSYKLSELLPYTFNY